MNDRRLEVPIDVWWENLQMEYLIILVVVNYFNDLLKNVKKLEFIIEKW